MLPFPPPKCSSLVSLQPGHWMITVVNDATWGVQCWSLLLSYWIHSSSFSQVTLRKWKSILMNQYITSVSAIAATSLTVPLGNGRGKQRGRLAGYRKVNNIYLLIKLPFFWKKSPFADYLHNFLLSFSEI